MFIDNANDIVISFCRSSFGMTFFVKLTKLETQFNSTVSHWMSRKTKQTFLEDNLENGNLIFVFFFPFSKSDTCLNILLFIRDFCQLTTVKVCGAIFLLNGKLFVDQFTYLCSNISSTESNVNISIDIDRLTTRSDLFDEIKQELFQAMPESVLLYSSIN